MAYDKTKMAIGTLNSLVAEIGDGGLPLINETTASLQNLGKAILAYQPRINAFCTALINRVIGSVIANRSYKNHFAEFKRAEERFGDTIQEIYFGLCKVNGYDPASAAQTIFGTNSPDVSAAYHSMNYAVTYTQTLYDVGLERAFVSFEGWDSFIREAIARLAEDCEYDEENVFKYLLATVMLTGRVHAVKIDTPSSSTSRDIAIAIQDISNDFEWKKAKYTMAGVKAFAPKANQVLFETGKFNAIQDVTVLATSFNESKADFMARVKRVDTFADIDYARLAQLFDQDSGYSEFTSDQKAALAHVHAVLCSADIFMIFDKYRRMSDIYNGKGMYRNYDYNVGMTWSMSPFQPIALFTDMDSSVDSITVNGLSAISMAGTYDYTATVARTGFVSDAVTWTVAAAESSGVASLAKIKIDSFGRLKLESGYATGNIVITATSVSDGTVAGTKTVTLS